MPKLGMEPIRKAALVQATIAEIGRAGSLDVTVAQIARRAGMSSALAHHYFGSKEQIFLAAMRHVLSLYGAEVRGALVAVAGPDSGPRARVQAIVRASFAPGSFRREVIGAWLNFYVLAQTVPEAQRLLSVYQRRLRSNLIHGLKPLVGAPRAGRGRRHRRDDRRRLYPAGTGRQRRGRRLRGGGNGHGLCRGRTEPGGNGMTTQPKASHFVDGAYLEDKAGAPIKVTYPATGDVIATLHEATPAVIEAALASGARAQAEWAALRPVERGRILHRAAAIIRERGAELAHLETLDTGKPIQETLVADWPSGADAKKCRAR